MKNLSPKIGLLFFSLIILFACEKQSFVEKNTVSTLPHSGARVAIDDIEFEKEFIGTTSMKRDFANAFAKSLLESKMLRGIIKREAEKMFNEDHEILYEMIRDEMCDGRTVNDVIESNLGRKGSIDIILETYPLLSILVPDLPHGIFNVSTWDIENQVPKVAVNLYTTNNIPVVDGKGNNMIIEQGVIPGFPILVIKDNERVIDKKAKNFDKLTGRAFTSKRGKTFRFVSDNFDRKVNNSKNKRYTFGLDQKLKDAHDIYENADGWERDYIYYDITPSQTGGAFKYDFKDGLTGFSMVGDPNSALSKISDQSNDPKTLPNRFGPGPAWTDGYFEFAVRAIVNANNGTGAEVNMFFSATIPELFDITYRSFMIMGWQFFTIDNIVLTRKELSLPFINWNLKNYSSAIKISIEEVDMVQTSKITESGSAKFATNFALDGSKIGLKFGATGESTQGVVWERTYIEGNDLLGDVIINFGDKVIINKFPIGSSYFYETREYNTGWYTISFEPIRVQ